MKRTKKSQVKKESKICYIVMTILIVLCLLPLVIVVSTSFTDELYVQRNGYTLWPVEPSLDTYKFLVRNKGTMLSKSFIMTLLVTVIGTIYSVSMTTCFAYAVTQAKSVFRFARPLSFMAWFTSVFSGGVLPWYILCSQYYGLKDNIFALFIPYGINVMHMFILRGNFREIPKELIEAAQLDGASHFQIFVRVSIPLARAGLTTVALFRVLTFWNDFYLPKWLIMDNDYTTMQKVLYDMSATVMELLKDSSLAQKMSATETIPSDTAQMAITVIVLAPLILLYPFSLKYFVKGINLGGVKG